VRNFYLLTSRFKAEAEAKKNGAKLLITGYSILTTGYSK
jgi:hypothetical protein